MNDDAEPRPSALRTLTRPALLGLHVFTIAAVAFTIVMGMWQLGVYDTRQADERADRRDVPTVALDDALGPDEAFGGSSNHRPVTATGRFGPAEDQVWVSGQRQDGEDGYWLVAPFIVGDTDDTDDTDAAGRPDAMLVVRGWSPDNADPPNLPNVSEITAVLQPTDEEGAPIDGARTTDGIRIPQLANELPYDPYSGYGIQTEPAPQEPLAAVPPPDPDVSWTTGLQNLVYAIQWWVFGLFAIVLWARMCRDMVRDAAAGGRVGDGSDPPVA